MPEVHSTMHEWNVISIPITRTCHSRPDIGGWSKQYPSPYSGQQSVLPQQLLAFGPCVVGNAPANFTAADHVPFAGPGFRPSRFVDSRVSLAGTWRLRAAERNNVGPSQLRGGT